MHTNLNLNLGIQLSSHILFCLFTVTGDLLSLRFPDWGRIAAVQFSVGVGVPLSFLILKALPRNNETATLCLYAALLFPFGKCSASYMVLAVFVEHCAGSTGWHHT